MTTKLNLTLNEATVRRIKVYAEKHHVSVSKIAENYFDKLTRPKARSAGSEKFSQRAAGVIDDLIIDDIAVSREQYLKEKYGV